VTPEGKDLQLIADNYATHKHAKVQKWLKRHLRFHVHFTPTSSSWLNIVERFFRDLIQNRLRHGVFRDIEELWRLTNSLLRIKDCEVTGLVRDDWDPVSALKTLE
jgi:hypothetical protein